MTDPTASETRSPEQRCEICGHRASLHLPKPLMCAPCASENRDGASHAFAAAPLSSTEPAPETSGFDREGLLAIASECELDETPRTVVQHGKIIRAAVAAHDCTVASACQMIDTIAERSATIMKLEKELAGLWRERDAWLGSRASLNETTPPTCFLHAGDERVWCVRCDGWKCTDGEDDPCPVGVELDDCPIQQGDESKWKPVTVEQAQQAIDALAKELRELDDAGLRSGSVSPVASSPHAERSHRHFRRDVWRHLDRAQEHACAVSALARNGGSLSPRRRRHAAVGFRITRRSSIPCARGRLMAKPPTVPDAIKSAAANGFARRERSCTEKTTYTHNEAIAARRGMAKGRRSRQMTIYHCRFCGFYHLTSA